jgi:predicted metal-dependent enzyme (double-stranded beta helix superfamily)
MTKESGNLGKLRTFVQEMTGLVERARHDEPRLLEEGRVLLGALVREDDWLPEDFAQPHPQYYQQYLLYCDPFERFSVVSFVWGPGQSTPVHDHTVWGLIGMLRGAERCQSYVPIGQGGLVKGTSDILQPGQVTAVSPTIGDIHTVANHFADRVSISIHAYGANIGAVRRHVFDPATGAPKDFVSGYASAVLPNLWDRSAEVRAAFQG